MPDQPGRRTRRRAPALTSAGPDTGSAMAEHIGATISTLDEGHLGLISDPGAVQRVIKQADTATRVAS